MNTMTKCFNVAVENNDDMEAEGPHSLHSSGQTPENAEFTSEMRTDSAGCTKEEDKAVFKDIQEVHQSHHQPVEERPWRKSGADISDYFNYGFDEESWKAYCRKHARLQTFQSQHIAKVTREQARYEEEGSRPSSTSSRSSKKSGRQRKANSTGSGGKAGSSSSSRSRKKARPCCSNAARDTQVVAGISHKEKNATNYDLPRSINVCTVFSFVPPPSSLFQFYQSMSSTSMLDSGKLGNFDEPSTSLNPYFVGNMATDSAVIDAANAWEGYIQQKRDRDRDRSREHGHDKRRCRDRGKQSSSSSHDSGRKQLKHRDSTEHAYKRRRIDGASGKKKQKEEKDGSQKPSQSRSSNFSGKDDRKKRRSQKKGKDVGRPQKATLPAKKEN